MAAYSCVISLKQTIKALLDSPRVSLLSSTRQILESAYDESTSLQQVLEGLNDCSRSRRSHERLGVLEGQIRDCANRLEDVVELHEFSSRDEQVRQEVTSFTETVKKMEKDYMEELSREEDEDEDEDDDHDDAATDFGVEMVGRDDEFTSLRGHLLRRMRPHELWFLAFAGENGSCRTVTALAVFDELRQNFDCSAWVTVSTKYGLKELLIRIIDQLDNQVTPNDDDEFLTISKLLEHRTYMIVLDDVREVEVVNCLRRCLPDQNNGSIVFITTSSKQVTQLLDATYRFGYPATFFAETMMAMIHRQCFSEEPISAEFEVAANKIIHNCRCLAVSAAKTLLFLLNSDKTVDQWNKIADDKENPIFMVADEISEVDKIVREIYQDYDKEIVQNITPWLDLYVDIQTVKKMIHPERFFPKLQIISYVGMAGIGKTTFVRSIFKDESVLNHFDYLVWITLGPKYKAEEILIDILSQIYPHFHGSDSEDQAKLVMDLYVQVSCKRFLIVLDDLCSKEPLFHLKNLLPVIRGAVLVTTRLIKVAKYGQDDRAFEIELLDKEKSWCLFRHKVFGGISCPPKLENAGRKIAEKCDGLPLLILTVADELLKAEISQEYWENVASGKEKSIFENAHHQISAALLPSYLSLPQHLKTCFLYIGAFCEKYNIVRSNLTNLWFAEGFLEPNSSEDFVVEYLFELVNRSLVIVQRAVSNSRIKRCRLHSVFWHLSNKQAMKNKVFHAVDSYDDCSREGMESQRRFCIRSNVLLGMRYVQDSLAFNKNAHSLLCVGPFHQYPVPLIFDLKWLRVLYAITVRFYEFPVEVVRKLHLRYLGLTCNGKLPTSISDLLKLQYLIVRRYMNIKSSKSSWPLPVEIWDMKELKHLEVTGGCLPNHRGGTGLLKLSTLLDINAQSCRKEILKWIPNLKRLGIRIELKPDNRGKSFHYLINTYHLRMLESLKCVVVNPQMRIEVVSQHIPMFIFPSNLKKLSLSGLGYPWKLMSTIGRLKNLEVLKLKCYAFQGPKWEMHDTGDFEKLKYLLIENTNLVNWKLDIPIPMRLENISIKHCYKLQEFPIALHTLYLKKVEIVDCSRSTMAWAERIGQLPFTTCQIVVHRSWHADNHQ